MPELGTPYGRRRCTGLASVVAAVAIAGVVTGAMGTATAGVRARRVAGGLRHPVAFTFGPNDRIFYVERETGRIRLG